MAWPPSPQPSDPADEALVIRCQLGERPAFAQLLERWLSALHRYLWHGCGTRDGADDLTQEVWLAVLRGLPGLRDAGRFRPWLFGIAHRQLADWRRRQGDAGPSAAAERDGVAVETDADANDPGALAWLDAQALADGLSRLPAIEREVVTLFHLEGMSLAEVACVLAVPIGTVKSRLFRARSALRAFLSTDPELSR